MTVEWGEYAPYVPPEYGLLGEMTPAQARRSFNHLMASKPERREQLCLLLARNGHPLGATDKAVQALNDWFRVNVEGSGTDPYRLRNVWYSVVNDIALFLGDVIIERYPRLRWQMFTHGKRNMSYQRHVLMGFTNVPDSKYNVDLDIAIATYGQRIVAGLDVPTDYFASIVHSLRPII
jgi:hypothetical protein